jgi:hypothetical protein
MFLCGKYTGIDGEQGKVPRGHSLYCHDLGVTIDVVWTGEWIY